MYCTFITMILDFFCHHSILVKYTEERRWDLNPHNPGPSSCDSLALEANFSFKGNALHLCKRKARDLNPQGFYTRLLSKQLPNHSDTFQNVTTNFAEREQWDSIPTYIGFCPTTLLLSMYSQLAFVTSGT